MIRRHCGSGTTHACVLTKLPAPDAPSRRPANACRKPLSEELLVVPPSALTRLSKLVCRAVSAELVVVLVPVALDVLDVLDVSDVLDRD